MPSASSASRAASADPSGGHAGTRAMGSPNGGPQAKSHQKSREKSTVIAKARDHYQSQFPTAYPMESELWGKDHSTNQWRRCSVVHARWRPLLLVIRLIRSRFQGKDVKALGPRDYDYYIHWLGADRRLDCWLDVGDVRTLEEGPKEGEDACYEVEEDSHDHAGMDEEYLREHEMNTKLKTIQRIKLGPYLVEAWLAPPLDKVPQGGGGAQVARAALRAAPPPGKRDIPGREPGHVRGGRRAEQRVLREPVLPVQALLGPQEPAAHGQPLHILRDDGGGRERVPHHRLLLEGEAQHQQRVVHPVAAPAPAEGVRQVPHGVQLPAVAQGGPHRHARAAAVGPGARLLHVVLVRGAAGHPVRPQAREHFDPGAIADDVFRACGHHIVSGGAGLASHAVERDVGDHDPAGEEGGAHGQVADEDAQAVHGEAALDSVRRAPRGDGVVAAEELEHGPERHLAAVDGDLREQLLRAARREGVAQAREQVPEVLRRNGSGAHAGDGVGAQLDERPEGVDDLVALGNGEVDDVAVVVDEGVVGALGRVTGA
ncbi:histone acetyltransferase, putative [Babesia caballi]|uniref:Histone acetyltransferase, putative n=1 Tax=Babesia caballi TaxID=5871 RepID=A0AAV4LR68_BABCB|nr:histone acetyltransferase, putative [Babesia caballi]